MRQELHPEKLLAAKPQAVFNLFLLISLVLQYLKVDARTAAMNIFKGAWKTIRSWF